VICSFRLGDDITPTTPEKLAEFDRLIEGIAKLALEAKNKKLTRCASFPDGKLHMKKSIIY
jgi:hypothetical protein